MCMARVRVSKNLVWRQFSYYFFKYIIFVTFSLQYYVQCYVKNVLY